MGVVLAKIYHERFDNLVFCWGSSLRKRLWGSLNGNRNVAVELNPSRLATPIETPQPLAPILSIPSGTFISSSNHKNELASSAAKSDRGLRGWVAKQWNAFACGDIATPYKAIHLKCPEDIAEMKRRTMKVEEKTKSMQLQFRETMGMVEQDQCSKFKASGYHRLALADWLFPKVHAWEKVLEALKMPEWGHRRWQNGRHDPSLPVHPATLTTLKPGRLYLIAPKFDADVNGYVFCDRNWDWVRVNLWPWPLSTSKHA